MGAPASSPVFLGRLEILAYLNCLSGLLFILARSARGGGFKRADASH
jgi:cob(I)alamin adenosyltransferase